ncbi:MAG TPA: vWA domain-containing protein [Polyangiaceae bacterium]|nr:vWA domain-containing protein [Polyangiaceae bacterium]
MAIAGGCSQTPEVPTSGLAGDFGSPLTSGGNTHAASGGHAGTAGTFAKGGQPMIGASGESSAAGSSAYDFDTCARATLEAEPSKTNLLFVIDKSGSMNCNPPDGDIERAARCARYPVQEDKTRPSKWQVTQTALMDAISGLRGRPNLKVGLSLFPKSTACDSAREPDVTLADLDDAQLRRLESTLSNVAASGETPLAAATIRGYGHLADQLKAHTLEGSSLVILLTDGTETCAPNLLDDLLTIHAPNARLFQIRTFVIGVPGSEGARSFLSNLAFIGGTSVSGCSHPLLPNDAGDCHLDSTRSLNLANDLKQALERVTSDRAIACTLDVPRNPTGGAVDFTKVNVTFSPLGGEATNIPYEPSATCDASGRGWQYSPDFRRITLCGAACSTVQAQPGTLDVVLGCPTEVIR